MQKTFKRYIEAKTLQQARERFFNDRGSSVPPLSPWPALITFEFEVTINYPFKVEPGEVAGRIQD